MREVEGGKERHFAYGLWVAISEVDGDGASDGLTIKDLQKSTKLVHKSSKID